MINRVLNTPPGLGKLLLKSFFHKLLLSFKLLAECTSKLGLQSAARKMFLSDGTEVVDVRQLVKDCDVYISMGEPFRNPIANLQG